MAETKRPKRPGTMRERTPGHWQLRAFAGTDLATGKPMQVARTFVGTEKEASKELARLVAAADSVKPTPKARTVGFVLDAWLDDAESNHRQRPRTLYENRSKIEKRIRPAIGETRIDKLTGETLDRLYGKWLGEGLSPSTVNKLHSIIGSACRLAVRRDWIDRSPTDRCTPPRPARTKMVTPTPAQLQTLIAHADSDDSLLGTAIALAALTGVRRGELVALRWSDVDLETASLTVSRSLTVANGVQHTGDTKTHQERTLALDPLAIEVLRRRWVGMLELSQLAESPLVPDPFVLSYNANGAEPVNPDTFTHRFSRLCRIMEKPALDDLRQINPKATRTDLAPRDQWSFRFHDLRHFSVTTLIAAGVDIRTVAERHGHARATMTLDRYAHALPERDRAAANVLGSVLRLE